jgi:hypothetical protein
MRSIFFVVLLAAWGSPKGKKLTAGDLGVVRLIKSDKKLVLDVYFPREWLERDVKLGTKITTKEILVLADTEGIFYEGPAPTFITQDECENDGGRYSEPIGRLELDPSQLKRQPSTKPFGSEKNIGLATLGKIKRKPIESAATNRTLARADFDGDGAPDAELRSANSEAGCGDALEEDALQIITATSAYSARCCGP